MLIRKGGITRNIDPERLFEYKAKGYTTVDVVEPTPAPPVPPVPPAPSGEKQPKKPGAKE